MQILETKRLILRPWRESDSEALYKYASDPDVGPRAGWPPHRSVEESLELIKTVFSGEGMWAVELKGTSEAIGVIKLVGIIIGSYRQRKLAIPYSTL